MMIMQAIWNLHFIVNLLYDNHLRLSICILTLLNSEDGFTKVLYLFLDTNAIAGLIVSESS